MKPAYYYLILVVFVFLLYGNTLQHDFILDDHVVLVHNTFVHAGIGGLKEIFSNDSFAGYTRIGEGQTVLEGGRYRPLSIALFAFIYSIFGLNPMVFHGLTVALFAALVLSMYVAFGYVFRERPQGRWIAFAAAILFAAHPVHTEVVANIKSCDEILALLFGMISLYSLFRSLDQKHSGWMVCSGISFLLACLSKENAITFLVLAPLALWFFRNPGRAAIIKYSLPFLISGVLFLILRSAVLEHAETMQMMQDPLNDPFLKSNGQTWVPYTGLERIATILYTFLEYLRLLVFPFPLTHDYYPFTIEPQDFGQPRVWAGMIALVGMSVYAVLRFRRKTMAGYSILFFLIPLSLVLNVLFPVGAFMAERFLFMPSVGFCLLIGAGVMSVWNTKYKSAVLISAAIVFGIFSVLTFQRNKAWKNYESLLTTDQYHSEKSAKLQNDLGTVLLVNALNEKDTTIVQAQLMKASSHLKRALELHPLYYDAYLGYGASTFYAEDYQQSVWSYDRAYKLFPQDQQAVQGLFHALQGLGKEVGEKGNSALAVQILSKAYELQQDSSLLVLIEKYKVKADPKE